LILAATAAGAEHDSHQMNMSAQKADVIHPSQVAYDPLGEKKIAGRAESAKKPQDSERTLRL